MYLSGSGFLVNFADPSKQFFKVKSVYKSRDHVSKSQAINKFTTIFGVKVALSSCFKQLPLICNLILQPWTDFLILYKISFSPYETKKRSVFISNKHGIYELTHELQHELRPRTLGN